MVYIKDLIKFIQNNKGKYLHFDDKYEVEVYNNDTVQACIACKGEQAFAKIEGYDAQSVRLYLESEDRKGEIDYSKYCGLPYDADISCIFDEFRDHPRIEDTLISLLLIH